MSTNCTVKIEIKQNETITVSFMTENNEIIPITLKDNQLECPMFITFKEYQYAIGENDVN